MSSGPEGGAAVAEERDLVFPAQIRAAEAYARTLLDTDVAEAAAQDAVAAFRRTLSAGPERDDASTATPAENETLLALTRLMSAVSVPDRSSPADRRQAVWASIGQTAHCTCRESAALLATRANGSIQPRESGALDEHLAGCEDCRALALRAADAEAAFRAELQPPRRGGVALGAIPRGPAYGALGAILAVVVGAVVLLSSGSGSDTSRAAVVPARSRPAVTTATPAPATHRPVLTRAPSRPLPHHPASRHHVTHHVAKKTTATASSTPSPSGSAASTSADTSSASASTAVNDSTGSEASATQTPVASAPRQSVAPTQSSAASTASQVSGSSSLPADSAPQKGIGDLTSTTP